MKILNPNNTTHTITLQPRFNPSSNLTLDFTNEVTDLVTNLSNSYTFVSGVLNITFDIDVLEGDRFSIEIKESNNVIYRGKSICTSQDSQDYKLTKNKYIYV